MVVSSVVVVTVTERNESQDPARHDFYLYSPEAGGNETKPDGQMSKEVRRDHALLENQLREVRL
jgi:hypothetical protein